MARKNKKNPDAASKCKIKTPVPLRWWFIAAEIGYFLLAFACFNSKDYQTTFGFLAAALLMSFFTIRTIRKRKRACMLGVHTIDEHWEQEFHMVGLYRPDRLHGPMPPVGTELFFREEPGNTYDPEAVKAMWHNDGKLLTAGYIFQSDESIRQAVRDALKNYHTCYGEVEQLGTRPRIFIGIKR